MVELSYTYNAIIERVREILDESEVPTVEGLADAIGSIEAGEMEFVIVPPAVLVELSGVQVETEGMGYVAHWYDLSITMLVLVESLPDKKSAYIQALEIGEKIINGFIKSPPAGLLRISETEFNLAFAGNGFVGLEINFKSKIGG